MHGNDEADFQVSVPFFDNRRGRAFANELAGIALEVHRVAALREYQMLSPVGLESLRLETVADDADAAENLPVFGG